MFFIEFQGHFHVVCGSSSGYYGDFSLDFTAMNEVTLTLLCRCCGSSQCAYKRSHLNRNILWGEKNCFNRESSRKSGFFGHLKENAFALIAAVIWSREMHLCITEYCSDRRTATDQSTTATEELPRTRSTCIPRAICGHLGEKATEQIFLLHCTSEIQGCLS